MLSAGGFGVGFGASLVPDDVPLAPHPFHQPWGRSATLGQLTQALPGPRDLVHRWILWSAQRQAPEPRVDELMGTLFMMDGHRTGRRVASRVGLDFRLLQQTYLLPMPPADPQGPSERFLDAAYRLQSELGAVPSVYDVMTVPADRGLMPGSRGAPHVATSPSFQFFHDRQVLANTAFLRRLSRQCAELGGRVHLTKNVYVEPDVFEAMHGEGIAAWWALKDEVDPGRVWSTRFLQRLLPGPG